MTNGVKGGNRLRTRAAVVLGLAMTYNVDMSASTIGRTAANIDWLSSSVLVQVAAIVAKRIEYRQ